MIVGISGKAGSGKDTIANHLVQRYGLTKIAFADPLKRFIQDLTFQDSESLWGDSNERNKLILTGNSGEGISNRDFLTTIGSALRGLHKDLLIDYLIIQHQKLFYSNNSYSQELGVSKTKENKNTTLPSPTNTRGFVIPDIRYLNELDAVKRMIDAHGSGFVIRVKKENYNLENTKASKHESETEQLTIPDSEFDHVIYNYGSLEDFLSAVEVLFE